MRPPPVGLLIEGVPTPAATALLGALDPPRLTQPPAQGLYLRLDAAGLALCLASDGRTIAVRADFTAGRMGYRAARASPRQEGVARACGLHRRRGLRVVDATAGLGRDAFVLAAAGAEVVLLERSPLIAALLDDALRRAADDPVAGEPVTRMRLIRADAELHLQALPAGNRPDVVYLDPMFARRGRGAVGKEMQLLQRLPGAPTDAASLLASARTAAARVVVKRHLRARPLADEPPSYRLEGRSTRFDVYQRAP